MAKQNATKLTARDYEILQSLDQFPLTPNQLCKLSRSFVMPFQDVHAVRRRLRKLAGIDLVRKFPYAVASFGSSPAYYKLTRAGYRVLHGPDAVLPKRRYFDSIGQARHPHTRALVDLLIHVFVSVHSAGDRIQHYARENDVSLETTVGVLRPDAAFQIVSQQQVLNFVVELDNGTERVRSRVDTESIERKIRGYDSHSRGVKAFDSKRYVVLFVTTRSVERLKHMMAAASALVKNPNRRLFLGATLADLLQRTKPMHDTCFLSPCFQYESAIPLKRSRRKTRPKEPVDLLPPAPAFC